MRVKRYQKVTGIYEKVPVLNEKVPKATIFEHFLNTISGASR
jgi:hypothetical protein